MNTFQLKIHRIVHWEYWPMEVIYFPLLPVWFYFALKAKSFFFFNAANPSIKNGGMAMESKKEIYDIIPDQFIPKTIVVDADKTASETVREAELAGIRFPLIVKPDIGMKALGVEKIHSINELQLYMNKFHARLLIQELINFHQEAGIFYIKIPGESTGRITGIVSKKFLSVTGNGKDSLLQLIKMYPRSYFQLKSLEKKYSEKMSHVLKEGEEFILVPYGSHTRGAEFTDISFKINEQLSKTVDSLCSVVPGFYFGRLDIRYNSFEELCEGKNFSVIEINGAGSEPTHIYDPKHSLFFAWAEIVRHWTLLYKISSINKKAGHPYLSFRDGKKMLQANNKLELLLKTI